MAVWLGILLVFMSLDISGISSSANSGEYIADYEQECNQDTYELLPTDMVELPETEYVFDTVYNQNAAYLGLKSDNFFEDCYYEQLDADSKELYNELLNWYSNMPDGEIHQMSYKKAKKYANFNLVYDTETLYEHVKNVISPALAALQYDHPELPWLCNVQCSYKPLVKYDSTKGIVTDVSYYGIAFCLTTVYGDTGDKSSMDAAISDAKAVIGTNKDTYQTIKGIHDYLNGNIVYSSTVAAYTMMDRTLLTDTQKALIRYCQTSYSAFYPYSSAGIATVCAGYAKGFKVLCDSYGIPCILVSGIAGQGSSKLNHIWNYVKLNNKWYAVDCTWDDGNIISYTYFLVGELDNDGKVTFAQSHIPSGNWYGGISDIIFAYPALSATSFNKSEKILGNGRIQILSEDFEMTEGDEPVDIKKAINVTGDGKVSYTSTNTSVIRVSDSGIVTILKPGKASVIVSMAQTSNYTSVGGKKINFVVNKNPVSKNKTYTVSKIKYRVTNNNINGKGTVKVIGCTTSKSKLKKLTIKDTVKIKGYTFKITAVDSSAFKNYKKLGSVVIGKNVSSIGKNAFYGDSALKSITIKSTKLKKVSSNAIRNINKKAVIRVPSKYYRSYKKLFKAATGFKNSMRLKK